MENIFSILPGLVLSAIIGVSLGLLLAKLLFPFNKRRWMRKSMIKYGAVMDVCDKCLKNTPIYRDGACHCLHCDHEIGIPRKLTFKGVKEYKGSIRIESEEFSVRPNEFLEGGI